MPTDKLFLLFGCVLTGSGVALGAFGAHGLRKSISAAVGLALRHYSHQSISFGGYLLVAGTILFSGSLYVLSVSSIRYVGIITPIGGLAYIVGWILLFVGILRSG